MGYYITYKKVGFMKYVVYYTGKPNDAICKCYTKILAKRLVIICTKAREIGSYQAKINFKDLMNWKENNNE